MSLWRERESNSEGKKCSERMSDEVDTLGILEDIEALIFDKLQVVSYKWLSRNYLVSSNAAKRLLAEFVGKHGKGFEVVYSLSGWLKNDPSFYHTRLVSGTKLPEAKLEFEENCSVQVYSVQTCLPQDPATLWNAEFVQTGELFQQLSAVDNCLRDNRFSGISYSFDKHNDNKTPVSPQQSKVSGVPGSSKSTVVRPNVTLPLPQQRSLQHSCPKLGLQSSGVVADVKNNVSETADRAAKAPLENEKAHPLTTNKKKDQNDKDSTGRGSSLANMWGRASSKSKDSSATTEVHNLNSNSDVGAEARISAQESLEDGNSEDDDGHMNFKRASNSEGSRKRKVVFDFSDEEHEFEEAVSLASPGFPKGKSLPDTNISTKMSIPEKARFDSENEDKQTIKEEIAATDHDTKTTSKELTAAINGNRTAVSFPDAIDSNVAKTYTNNKDTEVNVPLTSPKKRKVLKTRIDERGREVTEVIWEGADMVSKKDDTSVLKKSDDNTAAAAAKPPNRVPARTNKKSPALGVPGSNPSGKAGNKKGDKEDAKQKNILSFFKKA